jgi:hypothetical protein
MTDATNTPLQVVEDLDAAPSDAEADELAHREHAIMNRRLDEDLV